MKYIKQYVHRTVKAEDPSVFDSILNSIFLKAAEGGKEPEIYYYPGMGLCASVKYFVSEQIPEDAKDEYHIANEIHYCSECPYFELPQDRRVRYFTCNKGHKTHCSSEACDDFYERLKGGMLDVDENRMLKE